MSKQRMGAVIGVVVLAASVAWGADKDLALHFPFDGNVKPAVGAASAVSKAWGTPKFVPGRHGQGIMLSDGVRLLLRLPPAIAKGEVTISLWMKPLWHPQDNLAHPIFEIPARPDTYDKVRWSTGQWFFSKGWSEAISPNGVQGVVDSGLALLHLKPGRWTHVALVYSLKGQFRASYFDGEGRRRPFKPEYKLHFHDNQMWLGSRVNGTGSADVVLDDLRIYTRAINPGELPAVAGATFPPARNYALLGCEVDPAKAQETPHRKLAKPFAGGRLRVVFVCEGKRAREMFELAQRVDIEPVPVTGPMLHRHTLVNPETFAAMGKRVEAVLAKGNVHAVVLCSFGWNLLPEPTRNAVMAYVRGGGGLLLAPPRCVHAKPGRGVGTNLGHYWTGWEGTPTGGPIEKLVGRLSRDDEDYLTAGVPWHALPPFKPMIDRQPVRTLFRGGRVGKGRVLLYDVHSCASSHTALTPGIAYVGPFDPFGYEYALGVAAKAVVWAAGREGRVHVRNVRWRTHRFLRQAPIGLPGAWHVTIHSGEPKPVRAQVELTVRNRGPVAPLRVVRGVRLKPGMNRVSLPYTLDRFGTVFADVRLRRDKKVADWATGTIVVRRGNPYFHTIQADQPWYTHGTQPRVTAQVVYKDYATTPVGPGLVRWRLYDAYDRLVARGEQPAPFEASDQLASRQQWSVPALSDYSLVYKLVVDVFGPKGKRMGDRRTLVLRCRQRDPDDVVFYAWSGGHTLTTSLAARFLRDRHGLSCVSTQLTGSPVNERFVRAMDWTVGLNLRPWVHATALGGTVDKQYRRKPDLADVHMWRGVQEKLKRLARASEPYSPLFYSLGDETKLGPLDAEPTAHEHVLFRQHIEKRYGSVAKLNAAWGTQYKTWEQIVMPSTKEMRSGKANRGLRAAVAPFRNTLLADTIGGLTDAVRSVAPDAKAGIEGIFGLQHAWGAFDYWKVAQRSTFMGQYALGRELDMVRSFQKPGDLLGCWYNYTLLDREYCLYGPWHTMLRGLKAFGWYTTYEGSKYSALNPDFSLFDHFKWSWEELGPILGGIGKLVVGLERDDPGVFLLHEHRNLHRTSPHYHGMLVMTALLDDLGLACNWLSSDQVAGGALNSGKVKVLVLAGQYCMRRDVAQAIGAFVRSGGVAISDIYPGVSDGLNAYKKRPLDDLLARPDALKGSVPPDSQADVTQWATHQRAVGKGHTLVFGRYAPSYLRQRTKADGRLFRNVLRGFLDARGVRSAFTVRATDGTYQPTTVIAFRDGASRYVGLQRDYKVADQSPRLFEVVGPGKAHIYDVRAGQYLGHSDRATRKLEVARGALLAWLPYRVKGLAISGVRPTYRAGDPVALGLALEVDGAKPDGGVFRIHTDDPTGRRVAPLSRKVRCKQGVAQVTLQTALDEPVGRWAVTVTDIATGTKASATFELKAPANK